MPIAALIPPRGASRQAPLKMADQEYGRARRDSNVQTIYSRGQASSCAMQLQAQRIARWRLDNGDIIVLHNEANGADPKKVSCYTAYRKRIVAPEPFSHHGSDG